MSETLIAVVITAIIAPLSLDLLRYVFNLLDKSKVKEAERVRTQEIQIENLEKKIDDMRDTHEREINGLRASFQKEIDALRDENVKLQILVAENAVKLTLKDETIARLTGVQRKPKPS